MYTLVSAIAKPMTGNRRWVSIDIAAMTMLSLFTNYARVIATLSNNFLDDDVSLELEDIRSATAGLSITFSQFLTNNGANTLPTSTTLPVLSEKLARYADAFHAGYKIVPIHPIAGDDLNYTRQEQIMLRMTHTKAPYPLFGQYCLVNINGFFHYSEVTTSGIYVHDGAKSQLRSGLNQIGILSFKELGEIQQIPITEQMIYKQESLQLHRNRMHVDVGVDLAGKTLMLVMGGYLHVLDSKTMRRIGDTTVSVDFNNLNLFDRYYESKKYIDLTSLELPSTNMNLEQIGVSDILSDAALVKYMTLSQSFFVVLDKEDIFVEREYVRKTPTADVFISFKPPVLPLIVGHGKLGNYHYELEDGQWSVHCHDTLFQNRVYNTIRPRAAQSIDSARLSTDPEVHSKAFFLKIGTDF